MNNERKERKNKALETIMANLNKVEGFEPEALADEYINTIDGSVKYHLPVFAQKAWFLLKYPQGSFRYETIVHNEKEAIVKCRVYINYKDEYPISEATAVRKTADVFGNKNISILEWAETAATGRALKNAGFGLQYIEDPTVEGLAPYTNADYAVGIKKKEEKEVKENTGEEAVKTSSVATPNSQPEPVQEHNEVTETTKAEEPKAEVVNTVEANEEVVKETEVVEDTNTNNDEMTLEEAANYVGTYKVCKDEVFGTMKPNKIVWLLSIADKAPAKDVEAAKVIARHTPAVMTRLSEKGITI